MLDVDVQLGTTEPLPEGTDFHEWAGAALAATDWDGNATLSIRLVDEAEGAALNENWRRRSGPTNVLAFPGPLATGLPREVPVELGDLVVCLPVVYREACAQGKSPLAHLAHLVVHGTLHLRGFTHEEDEDSASMERLETDILRDLGFPDPYRTANHDGGA